MCISWQDIGDGLRFHLPDDIFTTLAPFNKGSIIEEEDEGKNYSEGEKEEVLDQISNQVDFYFLCFILSFNHTVNDHQVECWVCEEAMQPGDEYRKHLSKEHFDDTDIDHQDDGFDLWE